MLPSSFTLAPVTPPTSATPVRLISAPFKVKLTSLKNIGRYLATTSAEGLTYEDDNPSCTFDLTAMGIITILNEFTLRQMTSLGIREVVGPSNWTTEQAELYVSIASDLVQFILMDTGLNAAVSVHTPSFGNSTMDGFKTRLQRYIFAIAVTTSVLPFLRDRAREVVLRQKRPERLGTSI